jgi:hypothetical protein
MALTKLRQNIHKEYDWLTLYRPDLEAMLAVLREKDASIFLQAGAYKLETPADLDAVPEAVVTEFTMRGNWGSGGIDFHCRGMSASLTTHLDDTDSLGVFTRMDALVSRRLNPVRRAVDRYTPFVLWVFFIAAIILIASTKGAQTMPTGTYITMLAIATLTGFMVAL